MTLKNKATNLFHRIDEDLGLVIDTGMGSLIGIVDGTVNAATLPTFLRRELTQTSYEPGLRSPTLHMYKRVAPFLYPNSYQQRPVNNERSIDEEIKRLTLDYKDAPVVNEINRRGMGAHVNAIYGVEPLARWISLIGAANDLSDGRFDNMGYLAIPLATSLVYEICRKIFRKNKGAIAKV